jgi:uncharacterized membrane protein YkgB
MIDPRLSGNQKENHPMTSTSTMIPIAESEGRGEQRSTSGALEGIGRHTIRYSLILVLVWIGAMKFTAYEAESIHGLVENSPLMGWLYDVLSVRATSALIGIAELVIAGLIAARPVSPSLSAIGSALAVGMFATTLSFILSTPGVFEVSAGGFPALSVVPGQFLLKDIVLLAAALWSFAEAAAARR